MIKYHIERVTGQEPVMAKKEDGTEEPTGYVIPTTERLAETELEDDWSDPKDALSAVWSNQGGVKEMDNGTVSIDTPGGVFLLVPVNKEDLVRRGWRTVEGEV